jgi:hypothetical protein
MKHTLYVQGTVFEISKQRDVCAMSSHNSRTVELILMEFYIGDSLSFASLFCIVHKRAREVITRELKI